MYHDNKTDRARMFLRINAASYLRLWADVEVTRVELLRAFLSPLDQGFLERHSLRVAQPPAASTTKKYQNKFHGGKC